MLKFGFAALLGLALISGCKSMGDCCAGGAKAALKDVDICAKCPGAQHVTADSKCSGCGAAVADSCAKCPGVQVVLPDGNCSGCGMKCEMKKS